MPRPLIFDQPIGRGLLVAGVLLAGILPTAMAGGLLSDVAAYTGAADRLIGGEQLYQAGTPIDSDLYRYAPWFAVAWTPLSFIPNIEAGWLALLIGAAAWLLWRQPWWLVVLIGPFVAWGVAVGNVAPLMFAWLAWSLPTRWAVLGVAAAASLKAFPILFAVYLFRIGRWREAMAAVALTLVLVAPMLLFDLSAYSTSPEGPRSLYNIHPALWAAAAAGGLALGVWRPRWFGLAVTLSPPRFVWYDLGYVLVTTREGTPR